MSYFAAAYDKLRYPIDSDGSSGLRNAQLGAIHSIASFHTLRNKGAGIIVMPTGSGKTAVLMMVPYITHTKKALIVTPSVMVRGQIFEDFAKLITLKKTGVLEKATEPPIVFELKTMYSDELQSDIEKADVVIATPQCALSLSKSKTNRLFDLVLIDEAHHVPAMTWQQILINMSSVSKYLFTATPFRLDQKVISGDTLYTYPLSMAYRDRIFGEIQYIPIEAAQEKDKLISREAERVLLNDRQRGFDHYLMVRTDTKVHAKKLGELYHAETSLNLKRIDSSMSHKTIKLCIKDLKDKKIDGIICVDMLGEGFDFPNLKIAAVHTPHKSLASTLQFIGRFARTNAENIGTAKFIAMNDNELVIENHKLYRSDAIWREIIIDMSERKVQREGEIKRNLDLFVQDSGGLITDGVISLHAIRPNCHAKVFHISGFNIDGLFPDSYGIKKVYRNSEENTVVGIGAFRTRPKWSETDQLLDVENLLFIVHYQAETSLLFIYSQLKNNIDYDNIAKSFTADFDKVPRNEIHRVLGDMTEFEMFNTGLQNRYAENGESYRICAGSNVASAISPITGKMYSAGHVFCKAISNDVSVTIGYSSSSKIWSGSYLSIPEYVQWCDVYGKKIANDHMLVKTNTNYDLVPLPTRLGKFPEKVVFCFFSDETYASPPTLMENDEPTATILTDAMISIITTAEDHIDVAITLMGLTENIRCCVDGSCNCRESTIILKDGRDELSLVDYLNNYPLIFKTTDDEVIQGNEICTGSPDSIIFSSENILAIEWAKKGTDLHREYGENIDGKKPIQTVIRDILLENNDFDYLIFDHGSGEIADYITMKENDDSVEVGLFHAKAMKGQTFNGDLTDIYEVTQQAIKSKVWLKSRSELRDKLICRRKSGHCILIKGNFTDLEKTLEKSKLFTAKIVIVQPAISKKSNMPEKFQEVLASANFYINNSGRVNKFEIWGSE